MDGKFWFDFYLLEGDAKTSSRYINAKGVLMIGAFNVLGFIYNWRKAFLGLGVLILLWGLALGVKSYYYKWHVEPLFETKKELKSALKDLNSSQEALRACENSKKVEVFVTENSSVFNNFRETIKEMENEEINVSSSSDNFDWMYQ